MFSFNPKPARQVAIERRTSAGGMLLALLFLITFGTLGAFGQSTNTNFFTFQSTNYVAGEESLFARVTVTRVGPASEGVSVDYFTTDGTAIGGIDYFGRRGTLFFLPGETVQTFFVSLIDNFSADGTRTINVHLTDPIGEAATVAELGTPSISLITIIDDESSVFTNPAGVVEVGPGNGAAYTFISSGGYYVSQEEWRQRDVSNWEPPGPAGAQISIIRKGGSRGKILVDWTTTTNVQPSFPEFGDGGFFGFGGGGLAEPFQDFTPTNGTVALVDFQMSTNILIRLPSVAYGLLCFTNGVASNLFQQFLPPKTFGIRITNVRPAPEEAGQGLAPSIGVDTRTIDVARIRAGFSFRRMHYTVVEGQKVARIAVKRSYPCNEAVSVHYAVNPRNVIEVNQGGDHLYNEFPLTAASDYATPFVDFLPPASPQWEIFERNIPPDAPRPDEAQLIWPADDIDDRFIEIPILDDSEAEFAEDMWITLYQTPADSGEINPWGEIAILTIQDDDQPAGASEAGFNPDNVASSSPPYIATPGANNTVQAVAMQPDGKVVLGGDFTTVNTTPRNGIARMNFDGSLDTSFNPGTGASGFVRAVAVQDDGKILVGGSFDSVNGIPRFGIARLLTNGVVDTGFNPGLGTDGAIRTIAVQNDGRIIIGGEFFSYDGTNSTFLARLHPNGRLDTSFDVGDGPSGPVNSIALTAGLLDIDRQASGGPAEDRFRVDTGSTAGVVTVFYDFLSVPDSLRVYQDGILIYDTGLVNGINQVDIPYGPGQSTFLEIVMNEGSGLFGTIWFYGLKIQPLVDPRPVIGGEFTEYDGVPRNYVARLNLDGSLDTSFDPGTGADDTVYGVAKQGNKVTMVGDFTVVDLRARRGVARLNQDGSLDTEFDPGAGFNNSAFTVAIQPTGKPVIGGIFTDFNQTRRIGLARLNLDGTLDTSFMDTAKNQFAGIPNPLNPNNTESQENFIRSLMPYRLTNITFLTNTVVTNDMTNLVIITNITETDHVFVGGRFERFGGGFGREEIRTRQNIARIAGGTTPGPGNIAFAADTYTTDENQGRAFITLVRTNGSLGPVSSSFDALDRPPGGPGLARSGVDYGSTNRLPLWIRSHPSDREYSAAFMGPNNAAYTTNRNRGDFFIYPFASRPDYRFNNYDDDNIFISIFDDSLIEGDEIVDLKLARPDGTRLLLGGQPIPMGTALGKASAQLIIADNDFNFGTLGFSEPEYFVNEDGLDAIVTVTRVGGSSGAVSVDVSTQNGTANSSDYIQIPSRTLTFANGQTTNKFSIRIRNDVGAEIEETVRLFLTNAVGFPANVPAAQRLDPARATGTLFIIDDDSQSGRFSFNRSQVSPAEADGQVTLTVRRSGANEGEVFINYATRDGTARAGADYVAQTGILRWVDGDSSDKTITIDLLDNAVVNGEKTFEVALTASSVPDSLGVQPAITVRIQNDDAFGGFSFSQPEYAVDETADFAFVTVLRRNGSAGSVSVNFAATNLTAIGSLNSLAVASSAGVPDFVFTNGTLSFGPGETSKSFRVPIIEDTIVEGDKKISLVLSSPVSGAIISSNSVLTIVDDELSNIPAGARDTTFIGKGTDSFIYSISRQPDGKILLGGDFRFVNDIIRNRLARINIDGTVDSSFDPLAGPNNTVRSIAQQEEGRILVSGLFTSLNATNRNYIARLNIDSSVDPTFLPGASTDNPIYRVISQPDNKVIAVGDFSSYRGIQRKGIVRISTNGVMDTSFNPGTSANGTIYAVALQSDGKILIGGDFTTFNEVPRNRIARLNADGTVDRTFGVIDSIVLGGANASVRTIVVQSDNKILMGGLFAEVNGQTMNRIARLNPDGTLDADFNPGTGANEPVNVIALQIDGKILVGGDFTTFDGRTRNRITRLNPDGLQDPTINFGLGANATVSDILVQPDRRIVLAGGFTTYDGAPAQHIIRIHGGSTAGSGRIEFFTPFFRTSESSTNAEIVIRRLGGTTGRVTARLTTLPGSATPGSDFTPVNTILVFEEAETFSRIIIPIGQDSEVENDEIVNFQLSEVTGGAVLGFQPNAVLTIVSDDSVFNFSASAYSVAENFFSGLANVTIRRVGDTTSPATVTFTTQNGTALAGLDYESLTAIVDFAPGQSSRTFSIGILDDTLVEGNETFQLALSDATGATVIGSAQSVITIVDNDRAAGQLSFTSNSYSTVEAGGRILITVRRDAGVSGAVGIAYQTTPGTALPLQDYLETSGILSFGDGETEKSFVIPILDDEEVESSETIRVTLSGVTGGAVLVGPSSITVSIIDDDIGPGSLDTNFDPGAGANNSVRTITLLENDNILIGGDFTSFADTTRNRLAELVSNGSLDPSFNPGVGPNSSVADIELTNDERIYISGAFSTVSGVIQNRTARIDRNGNLDPSFNLPLGLNGEVTSIARQSDGKVVIGGSFDVASAAGRNRIARLNSDGTLDLSFNIGTGADGAVTRVLLQPDGKILVIGAFSTINGTQRRGIARLNTDGTLDTSFNPGTGANGVVNAILLLPDNRIVVAGNFTTFNGAARVRVARLADNGTLDTSFNPGIGPNNSVFAMALQKDGKIFIGGDFTAVSDLPRGRFARLNTDGSIDTKFQPGEGADDTVLGIAVQPSDQKPIIVGKFRVVSRESRRGIARFNNDKAFLPITKEIRISSIQRTNGGSKVSLSFVSQPGFVYAVESSTDLQNWSTIETITATSDAVDIIASVDTPARFFRVRRVAP